MARWLVSHDKCLKNETEMRHTSGSVARSMVRQSVIACRAELGKFPMIIDINKKILNYLDYLRGKDEDSIVKQSLQISIDLS